jgi:cellulose synthase/poly-beta-1,6-N-acetylglucosamine synthase-like glycosyltransferase
MWLMPAVFAALLLVVSLFMFPVLLAIVKPFRKETALQLRFPKSIDVLIPCHNEEGRLRLTLQSVSNAIAEMHAYFPDIGVQVICGLDCCTDGSAADAERFNARIIKLNFRSKWKVINALVSGSQSQWTALVDCGIVWDKRFLRNAVSYLASPDVVGFSPSYSTLNAGFLSRLYWSLEAFIKSIENKVGGPVTVHGATVLYRTELLKSALKLLTGRTWLNDDVVLPLVIRALNPDQRIIYSRNIRMGFCVCDHASRAAENEKAARTRVSKGNLQWMANLLPFLWVWSKPVFVLSLRRVFRLFWALIPLLLGISLALFAFEYSPGGLWIKSLAAIVSLIIVVKCALKIPGFVSSLKALRSLLIGPWEQGEEVLWK